MYVGDVIAVSLVLRGMAERAKVDTTCTRLLGDQAVAEDKNETTTPMNPGLDMTGFTLAPDTQLVTVTRSNFPRTLSALFAVDLDKGTAMVRELERLAALASGHRQICQVMSNTAVG